MFWVPEFVAGLVIIIHAQEGLDSAASAVPNHHEVLHLEVDDRVFDRGANTCVMAALQVLPP